MKNKEKLLEKLIFISWFKIYFLWNDNYTQTKVYNLCIDPNYLF